MTIRLNEVGPRDGLQNEPQFVDTAVKIEWIRRLQEAGLSHIESTSFVSAQKVAQLSDAEAICAAFPEEHARGDFSVLVPNIKGLQRARRSGVRAIAIFGSPSETFCRKNIDCSVEESLLRFSAIAEEAHQEGLYLRAYISCAFGCPYEGAVAPSAVLSYAEKLWALGLHDLSIGDTMGFATPQQAQSLMGALCALIPPHALSVHFHDTYGQALANIFACLALDIRSIDASTAGLGGCPYAQGASGNVAMEDLVYMLHGLGYDTGVDLDRLIDAGLWMCSQLGISSRSKVARARRKKV